MRPSELQRQAIREVWPRTIPFAALWSLLCWSACADARSPRTELSRSEARQRAVGTLDFDRDGVPNLYDLCPWSAEDGHGWVDGCPKPADTPAGRTPSKETPIAEVIGDTIVIHEQIHFEFNRADVRTESSDILDAVAEVLRTRPELERVECAGHADAQGSAAYNLELTQDRSHAVMAELSERKVDPRRLVARGYGSTCPLDTSGDELAHAKNRRVEFVITHREGRPTGASPSPLEPK